MPPRKNQRAKFLARVDVLLGTSDAAIERASERFPGDYETIPLGVDSTAFAPTAKRKVIVVELAPGQSAVARAVLRLLPTLPGWEVVLARTAPLTRRPTIPPSIRERARTRSLVKPDARRTTLAEAAVFVPAPGGNARLLLEAKASGCAIAEPAGLADQPELAAASVARLAENDVLRASSGETARAQAVEADFDRLAGRLEQIYATVTGRRRPSVNVVGRDGDPLGDREWITVDLHMHTHRSHDCSIEPQALLDHAEAEGLGAIAVTDHNVFAGALETVELARNRELIVIPGEEVKTDNQGEVIGLFLSEEIPRGMTFAGDDRRHSRAGRDRLRPAPLRQNARHPVRGDASATRGRDRCPRGVQREAHVRRLQRRGTEIPAQVRAPGGRRLGRPCLAGSGNGSSADAPFRRARGVSPLPPECGGAPAPEVACVSAVAQVGCSGQGEGPLEQKVVRPL